MSPSAERHAQQGFGLIEALVALVLFSGVGIVAIAWLQQSLGTSLRLQRIQNEMVLQQSMLDLIGSVNLAQEAQGQRLLGEYMVKWRTEPMGPALPQMGYPLGTGKHDIQMLNVYMTAVHRQRPQETLEKTVIQTVYRPHVPTGQ